MSEYYVKASTRAARIIRTMRDTGEMRHVVAPEAGVVTLAQDGSPAWQEISHTKQRHYVGRYDKTVNVNDLRDDIIHTWESLK